MLRKGHGGLYKAPTKEERRKRGRKKKAMFRRQCLCIFIKFAKIIFFSELCWRKAVVAYTKPQQGKKEESKRLRGGRDQIKFIELRFERW